MKSPLCDMLGIEFPLIAFSHCRDVVVAVSKAGGFGVLGAMHHTPATIDAELSWIDDHIDGKPYGVDVLIAENLATGATAASLAAQVPQEHRQFVDDLLMRHGVDPATQEPRVGAAPFDPNLALAMLEVAFRHPIGLIANALGVPPPAMLDMGRRHGVPVAALVGAREHAIRQIAAGVDMLVVQGSEAGGHCGEVSTMVLVPEVIRAIAGRSKVPVVAAGGIMTGQQMAACMAMGAAGVWTGSVWLGTPEAETSPIFREKMIAASSRDTTRSRGRTGKPSRQLRSAWTQAWDKGDGPAALPMPLQSMISEPALKAADKAAAIGNQDARALVTYWVGQGVGLVDAIRPAGRIVQDFKEEFIAAVDTMTGLLSND